MNMEWVVRTPDPFIRAKKRRRYVRGTIADRKAYGWRIVREQIKYTWNDALEAPSLTSRILDAIEPTQADVDFVMGKPGVYEIVVAGTRKGTR